MIFSLKKHNSLQLNKSHLKFQVELMVNVLIIRHSVNAQFGFVFYSCTVFLARFSCQHPLWNERLKNSYNVNFLKIIFLMHSKIQVSFYQMTLIKICVKLVSVLFHLLIVNKHMFAIENIFQNHSKIYLFDIVLVSLIRIFFFSIYSL